MKYTFYVIVDVMIIFQQVGDCRIQITVFTFGQGNFFIIMNLVGLPGKSGVGGGIAAVYPLRYSVAVWSPRLNPKGNSVMGIKALELLTTQTQESIF
jgi:glutaminase